MKNRAWIIVSAVCTLLSLSDVVHAEAVVRGEEPGIILMREVGPRIAYRQAMTPGPATYVDPGGDARKSTGRGTDTLNELSDSQIGNVISGHGSSPSAAVHWQSMGVLRISNSRSSASLSGSLTGQRTGLGGGAAGVVQSATSGLPSALRNTGAGLIPLFGGGAK